MSPKSGVQQGKTKLESPVKLKYWLIIVVSLATAVAVRASDTAPVDATQITAWLSGGIPSGRVVRVVRERGFSHPIAPKQLRQLESIGAEPSLIQALTSQQNSASAQPIPDALLKAGTAAPRQRRPEGEIVLRPGGGAQPP